MRIKALLFCFVTFFAMSCGTQKTVSRLERYPQFYTEQPHVILVMPPINQTSNIEAKDLLYGSISKPFAEKGYYIISPLLALDILKTESAYDSENFVEAPLGIFAQYFGADAVVFSEIQKWTKKASFGIETTIRYFVKSTKTNEIIFDRTCELYLDLGTNNNSVLALMASVVKTIATDHIEAARAANCFIFSDLPYGRYREMWGKDKEQIAGDTFIKATVKK